MENEGFLLGIPEGRNVSCHPGGGDCILGGGVDRNDSRVPGIFVGCIFGEDDPQMSGLGFDSRHGCLVGVWERLCGVIGTHSKETGVGFYTKLHQISAVWGGFEGFIPNFETYPY